MLKNICISLLLVIMMSSACLADATVFFKDNTTETGSSVWVEGRHVYLNKAGELFQFETDEVMMEETLKHNRIGKYARITRLDAQTQADDLVEQIIAISGFDEQMDMLINEFKNGFQSVPGITPEVGDILNQALAGFNPEKEKRGIRSLYRSKMDIKTLETVLAWMKSPVGSRILTMERQQKRFNPELLTEIQNYSEQHPATARRLKQVADLDKAAGVSKITYQIMSDTMSVVMGVMPKEIRADKAKRREVEKLFREKLDETRPMLAKLLQQSLVYAYREISDTELDEYIGFLKSNAGSRFVKVNHEAARRMTKSLASTMFRNIARKASEARN
ncbi:MAG TPA: hypothetical protein PLN25_04515 [Deltaproteobacteria bacterium]|nr:hypothetical protein [Deltaproteobacteria bacterium]HQB38681.1 hypothetical protein [Deltaproteobacteria bacterium]